MKTQSQLIWSETSSTMLELCSRSEVKGDWIRSNRDPCIYEVVSGDDFIIGIYVDNILLSGKSRERMKEVNLSYLKCLMSKT